MVNVTLKAKHYYFIANDLKNYSAAEYFSLLQRIKVACVGVADDASVIVDVSVSDLVRVFNTISYKPEGQANRINTEMMDLLTPQIEAGIADNNAEWIEIGTTVTQIRNNNWLVTDNAITTGKAFIQG